MGIYYNQFYNIFIKYHCKLLGKTSNHSGFYSFKNCNCNQSSKGLLYSKIIL